MSAMQREIGNTGALHDSYYDLNLMNFRPHWA
jgi:hypothetical protein